jgi:hypothetical protein
MLQSNNECAEFTENKIPLYFNSAASTKIELGEKNIPFYENFIKEYGRSKLNTNLWVGQTLLSLINDMKNEYKEITFVVERKRAIQIISYYQALYQLLVHA